MDFLFGTDTPLALRFFFAFIIVLGLIGGTAFLVRRFGGERLGGASAARGRQPRLAVIDATAVDSRRRLILIRRDNVEHLLMIGGPSDVVVEANIVRAAQPARDVPGARQSEPLPRGMTANDGSWPLQPEGAPAPRSPRLDEPVLQWPAEPEPAPPPRRMEPRGEPRSDPREPRPEPRQADPLAGLAAELSRVQSEAPAPKPRPSREREVTREREVPREREVAREREVPRAPQPERTAERLRAAPPEEPPPSPDQNLADMAQRLEAALRRPRSGDQRGNEPPARSAMAPAPEPMPEAVPIPMAPDNMMAPHDDDAPAAPAPQPMTPPRRASAKPAGQKSVYDSLEQEMASLLGRPNAKN